MKRKWEDHDLTKHWTIEKAGQQIIRQKRGFNRLGSALLPKFFQLKGHFSENKHERPKVVRTFVAEQLSVDELTFLENEGCSLRNQNVSNILIPICTKLIVLAIICTNRY